MRDFLFFLGLAFLMTHELDAMTQAEWRILPLLNLLEDGVARPLFVAGHIPFFAVLAWLAGHSSVPIRRRAQLGIDGFLMIHAGIHAALSLSGHPDDHFRSLLSKALIFGAGFMGLTHLAIELRWPLRSQRFSADA